MYKSFIKLIVSLSLFFTSTFSLAQIALKEMVVTSQKREQNLLDVPSALQAFSGDMLEDAGLRDTDDLINMVPDMLMSVWRRLWKSQHLVKRNWFYKI